LLLCSSSHINTIFAHEKFDHDYLQNFTFHIKVILIKRSYRFAWYSSSICRLWLSGDYKSKVFQISQLHIWEFMVCSFWIDSVDFYRYTLWEQSKSYICFIEDMSNYMLNHCLGANRGRKRRLVKSP